MRTRLQRKERRLCSHVADLHDVGVLHAVRKDLKDISYLARFAEPQGRDRKRSLEERVADAESFLGVVHDQQQLAAYIRCYPADRLDITTRRFLLGRLQRRIDDAIVEITPRIRDLCERW